MIATGTRSNVTPVVLREDTRPPAYGDKYFEGASRTFYINDTEYTKRVEHANAGGTIQREVVSIAELIPSHVQNVLLACTMNRTQVLLRSLKLRLRAMQGMVRAQRLSLIHI